MVLPLEPGAYWSCTSVLSHSPNGGAWPLIPHPAPPAATGLNEKTSLKAEAEETFDASNRPHRGAPERPRATPLTQPCRAASRRGFASLVLGTPPPVRAIDVCEPGAVSDTSEQPNMPRSLETSPCDDPVLEQVSVRRSKTTAQKSRQEQVRKKRAESDRKSKSSYVRDQLRDQLRGSCSHRHRRLLSVRRRGCASPQRGRGGLAHSPILAAAEGR